jgi:two-component system, NarL family, nitrate/nitrite response regulator NarL
MTDKTRVMVVADDPLTRAGLVAVLADQAGLAIAGQTAMEADLKAACEAYRPDVLLWDLGWSPLRLIDRLNAMHRDLPPVAVLLPDAQHAAAAWQANARALLLRDAGAARLAAALVALAQGLTVFDAALDQALLKVATPAPGPRWEEDTPPAPAAELTAREREVLRLLAEGLANKTIAHRLSISEHTVKFHVNAILGKLGVESRTEAVVRATRLGLILL